MASGQLSGVDVAHADGKTLVYVTQRENPAAPQVLCASPISKQCSPDDEFSAYYGAPVYVCSV